MGKNNADTIRGNLLCTAQNAQTPSVFGVSKMLRIFEHIEHAPQRRMLENARRVYESAFSLHATALTALIPQLKQRAFEWGGCR